MNYKLPKKSKLKKNKNFQTVYKFGKSYANRQMVLYVFKNKSCDRRAGFAAGKRLGNAVVRNRIKRLLREVFRLNQNRIVSGVDLVLVGRQAIKNSDYAQLERAFFDLCAKSRIWQQND